MLHVRPAQFASNYAPLRTSSNSSARLTCSRLCVSAERALNISGSSRSVAHDRRGDAASTQVARRSSAIRTASPPSTPPITYLCRDSHVGRVENQAEIFAAKKMISRLTEKL